MGGVELGGWGCGRQDGSGVILVWSGGVLGFWGQGVWVWCDVTVYRIGGPLHHVRL